MGLFGHRIEQEVTRPTESGRVVRVVDDYQPDSEVIEVAYLADNGDLYILLHSGTLVGYRGFGTNWWKSFKGWGSAGQYWNRYIKGKFTGINTDGVEFRSADEPTPVVEKGTVFEPASKTYEFDNDYAIEAVLTISMPVGLAANKVWEYADSIVSFLEENGQEIARRFFEGA